jgi:hypothetical protein
MSSWRRDIEKMLEIEAPGATTSITDGNHIRIKLPSGAQIFCASTPSDGRALRNVRATVRRGHRTRVR